MKSRNLFHILNLFLLCICFACHASTNEDNYVSMIENFLNTSRVEEEKLYVQPSMIYVSSDQILLNISGLLLPIQSLMSNESGIYVSSDEILRAAQQERWFCTRCHRYNSMDDRFCVRCKTPWHF